MIGYKRVGIKIAKKGENRDEKMHEEEKKWMKEEKKRKKKKNKRLNP